ncbi:MAG TPA: translocation/assembly module TamB, partial [Anaeromyxobacteraceae bacterium]|nr:translocation/assembly module TamB [Anaeromyxobacteraceae bacterium]
ARLDVEASGIRLEGLDRPMTASRVGASAEVALDLSRIDLDRADAEVEGVRLAVKGRVSDVCDPHLDLSVRVESGFREALAIARIHEHADADGTVAAEARVEGPARSPKIAGTIALSRARVAWFTPGDVRAKVHLVSGALAVDRLEWPFPGGRVTGSGQVGLTSGVPFQAAVETEAVDLADVFERVGIGGSWVTVKLDGKGRLAGKLDPPELAGAIDTGFRDLRSYTRSSRLAAGHDRPVVDVKGGRLQSGLAVDLGGLRFEGARVSGGRGTSEIDAVAHFASEQGFHVRWRGQIDLSYLGKVADIPWGGLASVDGTIDAAPYGNPRIVGRARADGLRFNDIDLGTGATDFTYGPDFKVHVVDAQGVRGQARWRGEGVVDLEPAPARVLSSTYWAKGRVRDLFDAVRDWVPRTRAFRDVMDGEVEVSGTGRGPAPALDGTFDARMASGTLVGRRFDSARASGTFERGEVARIERAELRRGTGVVTMSGWYGAVPPFPWDLDVSFSGMPLEHTDLPGAGWSGSASGSVTLHGSFEHPDVRFAANGDDVSVEGLSLGTVQAAGTVKESRAVVTGSAEGLRFEADATLEGHMPFTARAEIAIEDVGRVLSGGAPAGLRAKVRGEATAEGELDALELARARLRFDEMQVAYADAKVEASGPVVVEAARGRVELKPVTFTGPSTSLTLSGTRSPEGDLDLSAQGDLDLRMLEGFTPALRRPHGRIGLEAHVSGTVDDPVLVGAGR